MPKRIKILIAISLLLACVQQAPQCQAENTFLRQGIEDYNAGDYLGAVGHFGQALSAEFGNPILHYYMGNSYVHLRQRDSAIREFRIAYALDPDKKVGELSKQALVYMKADESPAKKHDNSPMSPEKRMGPPLPPVNPTMDRAVSSLQQQAELAKYQQTKASQATAEDISRRGKDSYDRAKGEIDDNLTYYRRGRQYKLPMPSDSARVLDRLREMYDTQQATQLHEGLRRAEDIQRSADNLNQLLKEPSKGHTPHLVPAGTNLYVRNYEAPKDAARPEGARVEVKAPEKKGEPRIEQKVEGKLEPPKIEPPRIEQSKSEPPKSESNMW